MDDVTDVFNPSALARNCMPLFERYMRVTNLLQTTSVDFAESLAIILLSIARRSLRIRGPNADVQRLLDGLFVELQNYYNDSYNNLAVRLGQLMLCVEAIEEAFTYLVQQLTIVSAQLQVE
ncbi:hypothetical protein M3Y99_01814200 [Aphelenchoides fujianensis]|nr:hypothetical protein M3Y99_01814200 [Aphelenchoides fujianensis]